MILKRCESLHDDLERIRSVADYQFGGGVGTILFPEDVTISFSQRTGRIRYILLKGKRLATMRPTDGLFSLSIRGAKRIATVRGLARCFVAIKNDVSEFIAVGGDVFAVHVLEADNDIRASDEIIVVDEAGKVLAVGRAVLCANEMKAFKRGVAVKVRRGIMEES
jgi:predicted RNA-binding protein (TIGR00451 family)